MRVHRRESARMTRLFAATALLAVLSAAGPLRAENALDDLIDAKDVICEFHNTGAPTSMLRSLVDGERYDMLLVIEAINRAENRARATSSKSVGTKGVRLYRTGKLVHFVQDLSESVVVTTVTGCEKWGRKAGQRLCVRYKAFNSWHFDTSVHRDPDRSFENLNTSSYYGACEPWYLNGVTTSDRDREALKLTGRRETQTPLSLQQDESAQRR
jgi:hypothetical protein